ncbi:MAG: 4-hydroxythreonine-4-phosphate dehydrogenase PdxA [Bacteroidetes bacterium GWE2_29_8]|nr:MAG: 4-hydroxythreonine-4-phosphate dehydrogenase PdxA [Bacteroidetes bacterium GWE2_29_8]OFY14163.1 MAG: 4-hydroxythreonine-4-phosphate dehydrogenase PdxA [Bacteroidetes bacterium GWF2_29_10]
MSNINKTVGEGDKKVKVGISIGDFNGIGIEVILKTLMDVRINEIMVPIVYGSSKIISYHKKSLNINDFNFNIIKSVEFANSKLSNLVNCTDKEVKIELGKSTDIAGSFSIFSLEHAIKDLKKNAIDVLVTAPINKHNIQLNTGPFTGHTEYLATKFETKKYLMLMVAGNLKIGLVTGHIPITEVAGKLTKELILEKIKILNNSLTKDFAIRKPKIAVLGLNPHAGDDGLLGNEEKDIIIPAIESAKEQNILAFGPFAADGIFANNNFNKFDAVLAMYHDQGLIPFKTMAFDDGVNFTAGLPIIRTSPDHGTGYDIAGQNIASPNSFRESLFLAVDIFKRRNIYQEISANPLKIQETKETNNQ